MDEDTRNRAVWSIGCLGLVAIGLAGVGVWAGRREGARHDWAAVDGRVLSSHIATFDEIRLIDGKQVGYGYEARVTYEYQVGATKLRNNRVGAAMVLPSSSVRSDVESVVRRYPHGTPVRVRYSPLDPRTSFLDDGSSAQGSLVAWIASAVVAALAMLAYVGMRLRR